VTQEVNEDVPIVLAGAGINLAQTWRSSAAVRRLQDTVAPTATVLRDDLVTDGPFADSKEIFGGFFLIDAEDLDAALEIAKRIPAQRFGGAVEVRPIVEYER